MPKSKFLGLLAVACLAGTLPAWAGADPCVSEAKLSVAVDGTADAVVVTGKANDEIYVCGFSIHLDGTTPTLRFVHGSGTTCQTGTTALTGAYSPTAALLTGNGYGTQFKAPAHATAQDLCIDIGGTADFEGYITYVRK